jgi:hypothetical protein
MTHTPGPWSVETAVVVGPEGETICEAGQYTPREQWVEDARLIAAAPTLIAACEAVLATRARTADVLHWELAAVLEDLQVAVARSRDPDPLAPLRAAGVIGPQTCECGHPHAEHDADVNGCYCRVEGCDCGCHAAEAARRRVDLAEVTRPSGSRLSQAARVVRSLEPGDETKDGGSEK